MVSYSNFRDEAIFGGGVLILIVMDNGLLLLRGWGQGRQEEVLILIVMDNGLLLRRSGGE